MLWWGHTVWSPSCSRNTKPVSMYQLFIELHRSLNKLNCFWLVWGTRVNLNQTIYIRTVVLLFWPVISVVPSASVLSVGEISCSHSTALDTVHVFHVPQGLHFTTNTLNAPNCENQIWCGNVCDTKLSSLCLPKALYIIYFFINR